MTKKIVHVVGTGTIGEPLIGLLCHFKEAFGIDEVTFHKRTPIRRERAKVEACLRRGAQLSTDPDVKADFEALGHRVSMSHADALERANVVIDCTPPVTPTKSVITSTSTAQRDSSHKVALVLVRCMPEGSMMSRSCRVRTGIFMW